MRSVLAALALLGTTIPACAQDGSPPPAAPFAVTLPDRIEAVPGTWDLSREGTNRRCTLTLTNEAGEAGKRLRFPAGCRRALPLTGGIAGWLFTDGTIRLVDKNVRPLLLFKRRPDQRSFAAMSEAGEPFNLVPLDIVAMRPPEIEAGAPPGGAPPIAPQPPPSASVPETPGPAKPDPVASDAPAPGLYALDRYRDRDVCRLDLGSTGVRIVPGCRDSGIEIFDPVAWSYAGGRLTLKAKRGHKVELVPTGGGSWQRDPDAGTTFVLRRVDP